MGVTRSRERAPILAAVALVAAAITPAAAVGATKHRAGCARTCPNAGNVGAGQGTPLSIRGESLRLHAGVVTVRVTCPNEKACIGAVWIYPGYSKAALPGGFPAGTYNGVDVSVGAGRTENIEVPLLAAAQQLVRRQGRLRVRVRTRIAPFVESTRDMTIRAG